MQVWAQFNANSKTSRKWALSFATALGSQVFYQANRDAPIFSRDAVPGKQNGWYFQHACDLPCVRYPPQVAVAFVYGSVARRQRLRRVILT